MVSTQAVYYAEAFKEGEDRIPFNTSHRGQRSEEGLIRGGALALGFEG